jgi:ferredoxin
MHMIKVDKYQFPCDNKRDILQASKLHFICIPSGCCRGGCGMCKVKVIQGDYNIGLVSKSALTDEERANGYTLACRTIPLSDLVIQLKS